MKIGGIHIGSSSSDSSPVPEEFHEVAGRGFMPAPLHTGGLWALFLIFYTNEPEERVGYAIAHDELEAREWFLTQPGSVEPKRIERVDLDALGFVLLKLPEKELTRE